jgi:hypothetical protein
LDVDEFLLGDLKFLVAIVYDSFWVAIIYDGFCVATISDGFPQTLLRSLIKLRCPLNPGVFACPVSGVLPEGSLAVARIL